MAWEREWMGVSRRMLLMLFDGTERMNGGSLSVDTPNFNSPCYLEGAGDRPLSVLLLLLWNSDNNKQWKTISTGDMII